MRTLLIAIALTAATNCYACLWDYDTLAQESAGMPDVKAVIAGGFPRNPPLYYEMRVERVTKLLADNPEDLDAYDAAGVACDRLGRHDEAIEWMARKLAAMDRMGYDSAAHEQPNHRYRYLANLGTFHAHRWFKHGANREDMADMERGRDLIKQAIEENPNAHFGREKYQLMAMEWVLALRPFDEPIPLGDGTETTKRSLLPNLLGVELRDAMRIHDEDSGLRKLGLEGAIDGLSGLIVQGNAWESVDVFYALAIAIQVTGRSSLATLAFERCRELVAQGQGTVVPRAPKGDALLACMNVSHMGLFEQRLPNEDPTAVRQEFRKLRDLAAEWSASRTRHMLSALQSGRHPDTDSDFWTGFEGDPDRMEFPEPGAVGGAIDSAMDWVGKHFWEITGFLTIIMIMLIRWHIWKTRRRLTPRKPTA